MDKKLYTKNEWDSEFFGFGVATITQQNLTNQSLEHLLNKLKAEDISLVYLFLAPEDSKNAESLSRKGLLVDKKITYVLPINKIHIKEAAPEIHSYLNKPLTNQLKLLGLQSGVYSRFKRDPHFSQEQFEGLFTNWVENSLSGRIAQEVYVYKENGQEVGLITLAEKDGRCDIGLLAVDENYRGKSIGRKLMEKAFMYAKEKSYKEIQVVTQKDNVGACAFYKKLGFKEESVVNVYHFWLNSTV